MAITKADFLEIGRRWGVPDDVATAHYEGYSSARARSEAAGRPSLVSDEVAKRDIEVLMAAFAASETSAGSDAKGSSGSSEKRKGLFRRRGR